MSTSRLRNGVGTTRHWSFLDLQRALCASDSWSSQQRSVLFTTVRFNSTRSTRDPRQTKGVFERPARQTRTPTEKDTFNLLSRSPNPENSRSSPSRTPSQAYVRNGSAEQNKYRNNSRESSFRPQRPPMPWNFRVVPETERIEGLEKQAVKELFDKHIGTSTVTNDAFSIKASRMPFREPPPRDVPPFVQKAMLEYEYATQRYNLELVEYEQWRQGQGDAKENSESAALSSTSSPIPKPIPPTKPLFVTQYELRNIREYPSSVDAPHPPFRVTFVLSKKQISKLASHRNFLRKKLSAAVEMVFREHARKGYEFLVFAKKSAMTTPQEKLIQLMKEAVTNPWLYGERPSRQRDDRRFNNTSGSNNRSTDDIKKRDGNDNSKNDINQEDTSITTNQVIVRWKNNRPPVHKFWWKHAMPNPLVRVQQTDEYLDQYCPKVEAKEEIPPDPNNHVPERKEKKKKVG